MAGRICENIFVNDITNGASNDIEKATELVKKYLNLSVYIILFITAILFLLKLLVLLPDQLLIFLKYNTYKICSTR